MMLPKDFVTALEDQLGVEEAGSLLSTLTQLTPTTIRLHPSKGSNFSDGAPIPWCPQGKLLDLRPIFTLDPYFHAGAYYVQEASSMFLWYVLEALVSHDASPLVLDLCGAPGGKATLIGDFLQGKGLIVTNEVIQSRTAALRTNILKSGYQNIVVANNDPRDFSNLTGLFDIVVVDAPCSGEGMFRKDPKTIEEWSINNVEKCALRQRRIIDNIIPCIKSEGFLIYSTCTFNDNENIDNVGFFAQKYNMQSVVLDFPEDWGIQVLVKNNVVGYQFYPHKTIGEGFFIAILKAPSKSYAINTKQRPPSPKLIDVDKGAATIVKEWLASDDIELYYDKNRQIHALPYGIIETINLIGMYTRLIHAGITVGEVNKTVFIPHHGLALSNLISSHVQRHEFNTNDVLLFLKKNITEVKLNQKGWVLATYKDLGVGWFKNLGHRINNYVPEEYRIRMDLPKI